MTRNLPVGDSALVCGTLDTARRAAKAALPVFMYNFNMPWQIEFGPDANGHDDCSSTPASRT